MVDVYFTEWYYKIYFLKLEEQRAVINGLFFNFFYFYILVLLRNRLFILLLHLFMFFLVGISF